MGEFIKVGGSSVSSGSGGSSTFGGLSDKASVDLPDINTPLANALRGKEETANKKTGIDANKTSDTFFPTVKAVFDWVSGLFVKGAASSTDNAIVRFNGITGKIIQDGSLCYIDDTGKMGINVVAPTASLDIKGLGSTSATSSLLVKNSSNIELLKVRDDGTSVLKADTIINGLTVGLGSGQIASNTVAGSGALAVNTTGYSNLAVGSTALRDNTTGYLNTAIGYEALYSNITGTNNLAIGFQALKANTASYNMAFGTSALLSNTSGSYNIAIGEQAVKTNTTGYFNLGIGYYALYSNLGGTDNTAIGAYALRNNTGGVYNLAIGTNSLFTNTNGYFNLAVGYNSLYKNTGNNNIGVGAYSLTNNTTGGSNLAIGYNSAQVLATGSFNVGVGDQALSAITDGNYNVALGVIAGSSLTSGSSNILIGYNVQTPTTTSSSTLNIGNLIYGDLTSAKKLGINTNAPAATLDVNGTSRFSGNATFNGQFIDNVGSSGLDGQVLKKVGGQVIWSNP